MEETSRQPLIYLGGDIMKLGARLARQYEYDHLREAVKGVEIYSPILNKSINDKAAMTEEQNNQLAEAITTADINRLWDCDIAVMNPEEQAIGTLTETGCLFGWKFFNDKLKDCVEFAVKMSKQGKDQYEKKAYFNHYFTAAVLDIMMHIDVQRQYYYIDDIRTNHLNEKDFRRSWSINQLLYGMVLAASSDNKMHENFEEITKALSELFPNGFDEGKEPEAGDVDL